MGGKLIVGLLVKLIKKAALKRIARKLLHIIAEEAIRLAVEAEAKGRTSEDKRRYVFNGLKEKYGTREGVKAWMLNLALEAAVARLQND